MTGKKRPVRSKIEKLIDHWKRLAELIDAGTISSDHAIIAVAAATKLLLESGAYLDEEGNWQHPELKK